MHIPYVFVATASSMYIMRTTFHGHKPNIKIIYMSIMIFGASLSEPLLYSYNYSIIYSLQSSCVVCEIIDTAR